MRGNAAIRQWIEELSKHDTYIASSLLAVAFLFGLLFWFQSNGMPNVQDQTEPFTTLVAARNFDRFGITRLHFLEDYATSLDSQAHPYYYTHNPDFPIFFSYLLLKLGISSLPWQNFTAIFILLLGFWYSYKAFKTKLGALAGLLILFVSVIDYRGSLVFSANMFRAWTWPIIWGAIYHYLAVEDSVGRRQTLHTVLGGLFCFLAAYYDYGIALFLVIVLFSLKLFGVKSGSWRSAVEFVLLPVAVSYALHSAAIILAVGPSVWWRDLTMTISNRAIGIPPRQVLEKFYSDNSLVLWGYPSLTRNTVIFHLKVFVQRIESIFGIKTFVVTAVWVVASLTAAARWLFARSFFKPATRVSAAPDTSHTRWADAFGFRTIARQFAPELGTATRIAAAFICAPLVVFVLLTSHTLFLYIGPFVPFFVFVVNTLLALALWVLLRWAYLASGINRYIPMSAALAVLVLLLGNTFFIQLNNLKNSPPEPFGSSAVLEKYQGHSFITNFQTTYVTYFTQEWVTIIGWSGEILQPPFTSRYIFERDKFIAPRKYESPEFFLVQAGNNQPLPDTSQLSARFDLVERGKDYLIYDLRYPRGKSPLVSPDELVANNFSPAERYQLAKLDLSHAVVTASSQNKRTEGPSSIIDGNLTTYWHVEYPRFSPWDWVMLDVRIPRVVRELRVIPRQGYIEQFWSRDCVIFQGSNDRTHWQDLSTLESGKEILRKDAPAWLDFFIPNSEAFRYYRLLINDPYFSSIAEVELYALITDNVGAR